MVDLFLSEGFNYFDTAHPYLNGESELALREALTSRYPREAYLLANKLTAPYFDQESDIRPFFEKQLQWCGVSYFDFYLMHAQNLGNYDKFQRCHAYETAFALKKKARSAMWAFLSMIRQRSWNGFWEITRMLNLSRSR